MDVLQRKTLQSHLKIMEETPAQAQPHEQMDMVRQAVNTHLVLYEQEKDKEGAAIYAPLVDALNNAKTLQEVKALVAE
jgi:hypothetical protein